MILKISSIFSLQMISIRSVTNLLKSNVLQRSNFATLPPELIAFMENKNMIVCWHPEQDFPYEFTKPLPEVPKDNSPLKVGDKEVAQIFRQMKPEFVIEKLAALTYTTKHRWYPRSRDKRAKKTEMDRPYL